jgi:hypothetical protein
MLTLSSSPPSPSFLDPFYNWIKSTKAHQQSVSLFIFLNEVEGGELIFPAAQPPIKIRAKKGLGVIVHNIDDAGGLDSQSIYGEMRVTSGVKWMAKKTIYSTPRSKVRTILLPLIFWFNDGVAYDWVTKKHNDEVEKWGVDVGDEKFELFIVFIPTFLLIIIAALAVLVKKALWRRKGGGERSESKMPEKKVN